MAQTNLAARNLSLMEELEKLEQSITLTLQEIDHNFSKAHRIVTTTIIPVVDQYGEHSRSVWEASKFWKQFFEASANVSLSGYEELANDDESSIMEESTAMRGETTTEYTQDQQDMTATPVARDTTLREEDSMLDDAELSGSTPRLPATKTFKADMAARGGAFGSTRQSPGMKTEEQNTTALQDEEDSTVLFAQQTAQLPDMSLIYNRGHGGDEHTTEDTTENTVEQPRSARRNHKDPLLHRVLDKNYRLQSTPHRPGIRISPLKKGEDKGKEKEKPLWQDDDSFMSSPELAPPILRSEIFVSPYKLMARQRLAAASQGPRTPGVSVQTPMRSYTKPRDVFSSTARSRAAAGAGTVEPSSAGKPEGAATGSRGRQKYEIDWDSDGEDEDDDDDLYAGFSPPKTIQFALPPSKLLQTPAREASRRIVDDILTDAGAEVGSSEYSPTMVKMSKDILNDSF
ncbi:hypothetical protein E4U17_002900 [Claviceps sp. LM77 group G4]|nr:hypothetical protein E4U17_002900 [Claviceps sp. LM77 group G4]KAG6082148.1 hypothetical protein E4U16_006522 [Claviceps sp. LM84 group G4]KAG6084537.1 hypothetical protein E4U33_003241 [Claviceps sp. LM78 group G4]